MEAGRELDALIAEKVMGFNVRVHLNRYEIVELGSHKSYFPIEPVPEYSTDIAAAMQITEKICNTWSMFYHDVYVEWEVKCDHQRRTAADCRYGAMSDSLAHAICLAALKALGFLKE